MQQIKRESGPLANEQLRRERQRRGWSRASIADQIGVADPKTIGRWERGDAFPSAYFLQRLCALFEMPAEALGLWQNEDQPTHDKSIPLALVPPGSVQLLPTTSFCDPALPPAHSEELVGRAQLFSQLKLRLGMNSSQAVSALCGLPGVGKSALAVSLAHDGDLRHHFRDGILWASLGPDADVLSELKRWGNLLEIAEHELAHPESVEEWTRAIHACIGTRTMLLIIDDAWTCQDALAFKIGGPNCAYLLTTRIPTVALYIAGTGISIVDALSEVHSLALLARFVPELVAQEAAAMRELAGLAGGLPLALQLIGSHLQAQVYSGQPRRWRAAIERLKRPAARLQLTMPRSPLEPQMGLPVDMPISLYNEIALSYRQLGSTTQQAMIALTSSLPHPGRFSEEAALAIDGVTLEALDDLLDAGLLASMAQGRYTFHQTIVDFARFQDEQAQCMHNPPTRVSVLRRVRGSRLPAAEKTTRQAVFLAESLPALIREPDEAVRFSPSRLS